MRKRVGDKHVLNLVKAFLKAGILTEDGTLTNTDAGTPQGALCEAEHKPPYEQRWVMPSAGLFCLVSGGSAGRALRIIPGSEAGEPVE